MFIFCQKWREKQHLGDEKRTMHGFCANSAPKKSKTFTNAPPDGAVPAGSGGFVLPDGAALIGPTGAVPERNAGFVLPDGATIIGSTGAVPERDVGFVLPDGATLIGPTGAVPARGAGVCIARWRCAYRAYGCGACEGCCRPDKAQPPSGNG